jgi:dihydroflavonol-4-reductase
LAKVLVTGATGFIGSRVAHLLAERGHDVTLGVQEGSSEAAIADLGCRRLKVELRDRRSVRPAVQGAERVFHRAE